LLRVPAGKFDFIALQAGLLRDARLLPVAVDATSPLETLNRSLALFFDTQEF